LRLPFEDEMRRTAAAWDEVTPIHRAHRLGEAAFFAAGGCGLDPVERERLGSIAGLTVAHLCCNCGQDTLSLANLGARCTGFDFSSAAIAEARRLSLASGVPAEFALANVLDLPDAFNARFDLVYLSRGVLVWLPDLGLLTQSAAALLRPGGRLFLYDQHPFAHLLAEDIGQGLRVGYDYFEQGPAECRGLDYIGGTTYDALPNYQFMVRLGDLLSGIAAAGLRLTELREYDHAMFRQFPGMVEAEPGHFRFPEALGLPRVPLMLLLEAVKD